MQVKRLSVAGALKLVVVVHTDDGGGKGLCFPFLARDNGSLFGLLYFFGLFFQCPFLVRLSLSFLCLLRRP